MASPRHKADDDVETPPVPEPEGSAPHAARRTPAPAAPTIQEVFALLAAYLTAQYANSLTDQEAVRDAARMCDDGHVIPAWRHLARMVEGVLNVPPGG